MHANEAMDLYERAMRAGERKLGEEFFEENRGHFWGIFETRGYVLRLTVFPEDAPDDDFDSYRPGSPEEAVLVIDCLAEAMDATPGFLEAAVDVLRLAMEPHAIPVCD